MLTYANILPTMHRIESAGTPKYSKLVNYAWKNYKRILGFTVGIDRRYAQRPAYLGVRGVANEQILIL